MIKRIIRIFWRSYTITLNEALSRFCPDGTGGCLEAYHKKTDRGGRILPCPFFDVI